jgi:6-hydroxycyclohex-1-ene-1-carbonyl-CoA dehydrogenase
MQVRSWVLEKPGAPLVRGERAEAPGPGEVLVEVAGCGVCLTDLGFQADGVPTRHALPLTLGHEVAGRVAEAGPGAEAWRGRAVVVPAVIPCGTCDACRAGRGGVCPRQIFPGNDVHGGFGSHLCVPAHGLCPVPDLSDPRVNVARLELADLSVVADAVTTPYQAVVKSGLGAGDLAVFVGAGGVGGFGVQIAAALGARVAAIDTQPERLALMAAHGAGLTLRPDELDAKALKSAVKRFAEQHAIPTWRWKVFETSGTPAGQATAWNLLAHGAYLGVVGFTPAKVEVRLSNLMAFDAVAQGCWGCLPQHYPAALDLVLSGRVALKPFVERRPLESINAVFDDLKAHRVTRRVVLIP